LLRPSWLALHVLVVLAAIAMVRLGMWQWGRGEATGSIRNYSYGLEWWAFVLLTAAGWVKFCLDETAPGQPAPDLTQPAPVVAALAVPTAAVTAAAAATAAVADEDPDLAAWNARFAELARRDAGPS